MSMRTEEHLQCVRKLQPIKGQTNVNTVHKDVDRILRHNANLVCYEERQ
jgi:hypothetical protein